MKPWSVNHAGLVKTNSPGEKYRDFTPGEFVFTNPAWFTDHGFTRVIAPSSGPDYYENVGFDKTANGYVKALA